MTTPAANITSMLHETRLFPPSAAFAADAHIKSPEEAEELRRAAAADPTGFWEAQADTFLTWAERWHTAFDGSNPPFFKWFLGGKLNASFNCMGCIKWISIFPLRFAAHFPKPP